MSTSSSSSSRRTIVSYTLTTSLFIFIFLCSVFFFTRRTLEPSIEPYHVDIPLVGADPRPPTPLLPQIEPHDAEGEVTFETNTKEEVDSRHEDVTVQTNTKGEVDSRHEDVTIETNPEEVDSRHDDITDGSKLKAVEDGGDSGEVSIEVKEETNVESVDQAVIEKMRGCDLYKGSWVKDDDEYPLYQPGSCPYVDEAFDCQKNGRRDSDYLNWRWKPDDCDLPRFNATDFLEKLRGKSLMLVGDSMNRNQFESMLCVLRQGVPNKTKMYEVYGHNITKGRGYFVFKFEDYNCSVEFVRSHFLVREGVRVNAQGSSNPTLSIDRIDKTHARWKRADILVFNTGHWWVHGKTARGKNYYKEGDYIYPKFDAIEAYRRSLKTWAKWIDGNVNPKRQLVFYRGYSSAHFGKPNLILSYLPPGIFYFNTKKCILLPDLNRGGEWDAGGSCNGEVEPVKKGSILDSYPLKMKIVEEAIKEMKVPVILLNVTKLTNFRKDGHPSIYGKTNTDGKQVRTRRQDCSHWCLPGIPDVWNHLIYTSLLLQEQS